MENEKDDIIREAQIKGRLEPIDFETMKIVEEQATFNIFKIEKKNSIGTGFFCLIPFPDKLNKLPILATCHHVLTKEDINIGKEINLIFKDGHKKKLLIDKDRKTYTSDEKNYDSTFIEIKKEDGFDINEMIEIDKNLYKENISNIYKGSSIYITHYPNGKEIKVSFEILQNINEDNYRIYHLCATKEGSSGSPIFNLKNYNVIGIHTGKHKNHELNIGTLIKGPILEFNEYEKKNKNQIRTIKNNPDTKYFIDLNEPLCIGLHLDNSECKISLVNQTNGDIELFCFEKDQYNIPTIISFNDNNEIIIGNEAELLNITNPDQTIFNLLKMAGRNYNEIKGMKEIWPFKIYSDGENERPYIKINFNKKEKKLFIEDLLNLFLELLFEKFFKKIVVSENKEENNKNKEKYIINIILVVAVPNNFNYFQRKVIEKIFQRQIFPEISAEKENLNNSNNNDININTNEKNKKRRLYNGYQINLQKIKIENASSIATLCLKGSKKNELKDNNSLIINIGGGSVNLSITSINTNKEKKIYEVKALNSAEFGEEDFTDKFVYDCLKEFDEKIYKECMANPGALAKLRRSCSIAKNYFDKNPQIQIKVSKLYGDIDLKMILIKNDYEKACNDLFIKINILIKEILKKAKLSEIDIDNILLIGATSRTDKIKNMLKELFKHNRFLYNKLSLPILSDNDNDYYIVIGAAFQSVNLIMKEPKYIINDITPMSFGVETINGLMELVIEKGTNIPVQKEKFVKIRNDEEQCLEIKIYEGDDNNVNKNRLISSANIDKRNFKTEKIGRNYIEILIQFEIDSNLNLSVYLLDVKTFKRRFECLINIDVVKN